MAAEVPLQDPTSQSNYTKITTTNVSLDWTIDFEKRYIYGSATHRLVAREDVTEVMYVDPTVISMTSLINGVDKLRHTCVGHRIGGGEWKCCRGTYSPCHVNRSLPIFRQFMHDQLRRDWIPSIQSWGLRSMSPSQKPVQRKPHR